MANSLALFFAQCVIHDFFRSDTGRGASSGLDRPWVNLHSSYLDCQILYGYDQESNAIIRDHSSWKSGPYTVVGGKIKDGFIGDTRLERLPVCRAIVTLFQKEHNYVAEQLAARYPELFLLVGHDETRFEELRVKYQRAESEKNPSIEHMTADERAEFTDRYRCRQSLDGNLLYEQTRLVVSATWLNCIIHAYSDALFLELNRDNLAGMTNALGNPFEKVNGFHASYEFNIIYRFHTCIPEYWNHMQGMGVCAEVVEEFEEDQHLSKEDKEQIKAEIKAEAEAEMQRVQVSHRQNKVYHVATAGGPTRVSAAAVSLLIGDYEHSISEEDQELDGNGGVKEPYWSRSKVEQTLLEAMNTPCGAFGTHNTMDLMIDLGIEQKAILDARKMGCCRLNEFRARIGLPRYKCFEDLAVRSRRWFCSDEEWDYAKKEAHEDVEVLKHFYKHIDNVELSVGYMCEEAQNAGLGFSETLGMGIIADAFSSVRQDKFYQTRFTPAIYTEWGFEHAKHTCLQELVNRHLDLPYIDRSTSLCRLPQTWRKTHEKCKQRSRAERKGLIVVRNLGMLLFKFNTGAISELEAQALLDMLINPEKSGVSKELRLLVMELSLRKQEAAEWQKQKYTRIINDFDLRDESSDKYHPEKVWAAEATLEKLRRDDENKEAAKKKVMEMIGPALEAGDLATQFQKNVREIFGIIMMAAKEVVAQEPELLPYLPCSGK